MPSQVKRLNANIGADLHDTLRELATAYDIKVSVFVRDAITLYMYVLRHPLHELILIREPEALVAIAGTEVREPLLPAMPRRREPGERPGDDVSRSDVLTLSVQPAVHDRLREVADKLGVTMSELVKYAISLQLRLFDARRRSIDHGDGDVAVALVRSTNGNWRDADPNLSVLILDVFGALSPELVAEAAREAVPSGSSPISP